MHHGPMHHGPHHHHHHGPIFFFGPRRRYYGGGYHGGGCFGGAFAAVLFIMIFLIIFVSALTSVDVDNGIGYDEGTFENFANARYSEAFAGTKDSEGNILIVFLIYEGYDGYDCIPWGGYHIDDVTDELFGSYFESAVRNSIPDYYEHALTKSFRGIINKMTNAAPENVDSGTVDTKHSVLYNNTALEIDAEIVNAALQAFTEKTGYPIAIVVEDGVEVFGCGEEENDDSWVLGLALLLIIGVPIVIFAINSANKSKKEKGNTDKTDPDAGQGTYDPNSGTWK